MESIPRFADKHNPVFSGRGVWARRILSKRRGAPGGGNVSGLPDPAERDALGKNVTGLTLFAPFRYRLLRFCHSVTRFLRMEKAGIRLITPILRYFRTMLHFHYKWKKGLAFPFGICYYANREAQKASFLPGANAKGTGEDASG